MVSENSAPRFLPQKNLLGFIGRLMELGEVYAPRAEGPVVDLKRIGDPNEVVMDFDQTRQGVKAVVEPQNEILLTYDAKSGLIEQETLPKIKKRIVFWCRPCDARALTFLDDNFYDEPIEDPYYARRRKDLVIIALGCEKPFPYCFCSSTGGNPFGRENLDILMTQIMGGYLLEMETELGREIAGQMGALLREPTKEQIASAKEIHEKAAEGLMRRMPDIRGLPSKFLEQFESPVWKKWGEKCIGCGICTYLCPTCWCFDINDIETKGKGYRMRSWDSCQFPLFTLHTSSHNPRPDKASRVRQRVMHKFCYHPTNYPGHIACVGCGRCSELCPMDIDLIAILRDISGEGDESA
ncbi:MAG: 4Fe-4S dicluster domain-containing protein [Thermoplasmata archaeon]